jgi:predicted permease
VSFADLEDYRAATADIFEGIAGYSVGFLGLGPGSGPPTRVLVTWVSGNYFQLLGLEPALGRLIQADEGGRGRADAIGVLGYSTWRRRFAADRSVIGTIVRVNGQPCTIVGVAPPEFAGTFAFSESELYLPLNWSGTYDFDDRRARSLHAIARLRPDVTIERAQAAMSVVAERLARQYPDSNRHVAVRVLPERFARPEEDQFRTNTLGAGRGRLVRQMVTESLMLAVAGGGALLAAVRLPGDLPVRFDFHLDSRVLIDASTIALVTGLVVGLLPALQGSGIHLDRALRESRHVSPGRQGRGVSRLLVVAQISTCFVLLVAAGLFVRSLLEAERADLGFRPDGVLNVHMDVGQLGHTEARGRAFFEEVERNERSLPGVEHVSFAFTIPMGYVWVSTDIEAEAGSVGGNESVSAGKNIVSPEYFETMGIPVIRGRSFSVADHERSRPVAIVNQRLAEIWWPDGDPIGRRFRPAGSADAWVEVVGVTTTGKGRFLFEDPQPGFYVPIAREYTGLRVLQVRASVLPDALAPAIERAIRGLEPNLPLYDVQSMRQALGSGLGLFPVRVGAVSAATFGLLAFVLAIIGLYGVVAYLASQRTHEIGVRLAVGATRQDIVRLVVRDGLQLVVIGLAAGLLIVVASSRVVERFLFGVSPHDPHVLVGLPLVLGCVAVTACAIPGIRASRIDPTVSLRTE